MRRKWSYLILAFVVILLVGCGDSPKLTLRDTLTFFNEIDDALCKFPDDDTAEAYASEFLKNPIYLLKQRSDAVKHRWENYKQNDKEAMSDVKEAVKYWEVEFKAWVERFKYVTARYDKIMDRLAEEEAQKHRAPPQKLAEVGSKKDLKDKVAEYEGRGIHLEVIELEAVCPNLTKVKEEIKLIMKKFEGTGPVPRTKRPGEE